MNRVLNKITEGFVKAIGLLAESGAKTAQKAAEKPKWRFEHSGTAIHATKCLRPAERAKVDQLLKQIHATEDEEGVKELIRQLRQYDVKGVRVKRATRIDYSRYQGEALALLKAFGGAKEQARAEKRRASMQLQAA